MKKTMLILALAATVMPMALAQQEKTPDAVAALQALEATPPIAAENANVVWNTGVYSYDEAGNITAIGTQYFVYDTVGRLKKARVARDFAGADAVTQTFVYDEYGNLKQLAKEGGPVQSIAVSAGTNRMTALGTGYDEAGNLTNWSVGTVAYAMTFDALGMPTKLQPSNAPVRAYVYTADDERLFTYDDASTAESHWTLRDVDGNVLRDYRLLGTTWSVWRDYYYRDGLMLASADAVSELHYSLDHLGTPRLLTNASRQQIAFQTFLPFGEELTPSPLNNGAVKKFTGHERDSDPAGIGEPLDYLYARFYNGRWGRFLSVDPLLDLKKTVPNPQSWNRYSYVTNNPINRTDPDGRADVGLDCVPASVCTPRVKAAVRDGQTQALKVTIAAVGVYALGRFAAFAGRALFSWALANPNQATQAANAILSPQGSSALPVVPISGEVLREFSTSKGAVGILANASSEGTVLTLKDAAIYPMNSGGLTNQVGLKQMREALQQLGSEAKAAGYTQLVIEGTRVSGANPGKAARISLDLTKLE